MAKEDIVQFSDRAYLNVGVVGAIVTVVEKHGPIASITAPAAGTLRVTFNTPIPNSQLMTLVNPYAPYCVLQTGLDETSTNTVKDFKFVDSAGVPLVSYGVRIAFSRRTSTSVSLLAEVEPEEQTVWLADWSPDLVRYVPISYLNGSDDNIGYIDAAPESVFTPADLREIALKTIEEFLLRFPRQGNGLQLVALLEGDPNAVAPTSYYDKDGTSLSVIDVSGVSGYTTFLMRASDFTNNDADQLRCATYVKQAGPGTGGRWTVQSWSAPKITVTSATLNTTFGALEGCSLEFDGNVTAALATKGGIVKHTETNAILNVGIGSGTTQTAPQANDTFLITSPSVRTGPIQGSQSNLSKGSTATGVTSRFPGSQFVGIEQANPGTYTNSAQYRLLCNMLVFSKCLLSGFTSGRFSSGDGFQFIAGYFTEGGSFLETGHSFAFNAGASGSLGFTGLANDVPNAPSPTIANIVTIGANAANCEVVLDGVFGSATSSNSAVLTRSAVHGVLRASDLRVASPANLDQCSLGGANGIYDQLLVRARINGDVVQFNGGCACRFGNAAIGGLTGDAMTNQGANNFVQLLNVVNADTIISGYGLNMAEGVRAVQSRFVDEGGNTVAGTAGQVQLQSGVALTWAGITQGFQSVAGNSINKRSQTVGSFQKLTLDTLMNGPIVAADPASPANGDIWIKDTGGVRTLNVRIAGATYAATLV